MQFRCKISEADAGKWSVRYDGTDLGPVTLTAATREEALEKMRRELGYRLELCPCTGEMYQHIDVKLVEE